MILDHLMPRSCLLPVEIPVDFCCCIRNVLRYLRTFSFSDVNRCVFIAVLFLKTWEIIILMFKRFHRHNLT